MIRRNLARRRIIAAVLTALAIAGAVAAADTAAAEDGHHASVKPTGRTWV